MNLTQDQFMEIFGGVYEKTPAVAQYCWQETQDLKPCKIETIATIMRDYVNNNSDEFRLALLQSHPELVGKLALAGKLTTESTREQAGAGLNQCSPEEFAQFQSLNDQYNAKFGFPFIIAVTGLTRGDILQHFRTRIHNNQSQEMGIAMEQVHKIALIRLNHIFAQPPFTN